ncbi:hypothetical protein MLD38_040099 [Melastoma candidum]|uniref:Uncharacterized protein n=1 Tax=Melastoma candidum TaxID=119954 RepID=A0ACB9L479_9MYRT|nr:hypothetical protein MLD38_040099 [Melastoma candidum]
MEGGGFHGRKAPFRACPPVTALDRFLSSQNNSTGYCCPKITGDVGLVADDIAAVGVDSVPWHGTADARPDEFLWANTIQEASFVGHAFVDHENSYEKWMYDERKPDEVVKEVPRKRIGASTKRTKRKQLPALVKGQWTDEEDRKLMELVNEYGIRRWALIAEKLVGRAGKQCRERWHNHLRPDIKKDGWSEEEERLLVEAHEAVGNRWAEIAKCIPGRTENTIKNHWNAAKRRQNSKRKNRRSGDSPKIKNPKSSVLEDYIRSKIGVRDNRSSESIISVEDPESNSEGPNSLILQPNDDELLYMQKLFGQNNQGGRHPLGEDNVTGSWLSGNCDSWNDPRVVNHYPTAHLCSDIYLSHLLNDAEVGFPAYCYGCGYTHSMKGSLTAIADEAGASIGTREMDLMELVSSSRFSQMM